MSDQEICRLYDIHINMTLKQLASITGLSIRSLKLILNK